MHKKIAEYIERLSQSQNISEIKVCIKDIEEDLLLIADQSVSKRFKIETLFQENEFSPDKTKESIIQAKENAIRFLEKLKDEEWNVFNSTEDFMTENLAVGIIDRILTNFYTHIEEMYERPVHGKAGITKEILEQIKIKNEYDVQRILYSIVKPIFLDARLEVVDDTGNGSVRYDITIEKFNIVIEVKCSRDSTTQKKLTEEIASDIYHYKYSNIFFFVYDKSKIITNKESFESTYTKLFDGKKVKTIVVQSISL